jgi:hypothetical protein
MNDQSHVAAHDAASAAAPPPSGDKPRFVRATVQAVDQTLYLLTVKIGNNPATSGVSYNPLAYIPKKGEMVWLAEFGQDPKNWWVIGVASGDMFNTTALGRTPSAALRRDSDFNVETATNTVVQMTAADWDTDKMVPDNVSTITKITPQRAGLYAIKAGGRWNPNPAGRRIMDLRWAGTQAIIARDERGPNDTGDCAHSVSVDVMITDVSASPSSRVRILTANPAPAVELVVHQTSGSQLALRRDVLFLQMTYQGPKP